MGIVITFFALGIFILIMVVLQRFFPPVSEEEGTESEFESYEGNEENILVRVEDEQEEGAVVAAIAAALSYIKAQEKSASLGEALREGHSGWWATRRAEANTGRIVKR
jgi:Na+-transporting methylmalonyl-CoA/oxaloacetate decarboxylase gamma subunit